MCISNYPSMTRIHFVNNGKGSLAEYKLLRTIKSEEQN